MAKMAIMVGIDALGVLVWWAVVALYWSWYAVAGLGLPELPSAGALSVAMLLGLVAYTPTAAIGMRDETAEFAELAGRAMGLQVGALVLLLKGWVVYMLVVAG